MSLKSWFIKQQIRRQKDYFNNLSIMDLRNEMEAAFATLPMPQTAVVSESRFAKNLHGKWIKDDLSDTNSVLLYLHGGGFCQGSSQSYQRSGYDLVSITGIQMFLPDYRLAPESPFPAAIYDCVKAYDFLVEEGYAPDKIAIVADSAGSALALSTVSVLKKRNASLPACLVLLSPCVTVEMYDDSHIYRDLEQKDVMLSEKILRTFSNAYLNGHDPKDPLASPIYADLTGFPPIFISIGTDDMLIDSARSFYMRALDHSVDACFYVNDGCMHAHHLLGLYVPEAEETISKASVFLRKKLNLGLSYKHHKIPQVHLDKD
jgi:monoterpene epsilon-lactone hydrolase